MAAPPVGADSGRKMEPFPSGEYPGGRRSPGRGRGASRRSRVQRELLAQRNRRGFVVVLPRGPRLENCLRLIRRRCLERAR